jgi:hypothetical protein
MAKLSSMAEQRPIISAQPNNSLEHVISRAPSSSGLVLPLDKSCNTAEQEAPKSAADSPPRQMIRTVHLNGYGTISPTDLHHGQGWAVCSAPQPQLCSQFLQIAGQGTGSEKTPMERWEAEDAGSQPWNVFVNSRSGVVEIHVPASNE